MRSFRGVLVAIGCGLLACAAPVESLPEARLLPDEPPPAQKSAEGEGGDMDTFRVPTLTRGGEGDTEQVHVPLPSATAPGRRLSADDLDAILPRGDAPLAEVGGEPLLASRLAVPLFFHFSREARDLLRKLVADELVRRESRRLGVTADEAELERGVREAIETIRQQVALEFKGQRTLEDFLEKELGVGLPAYERAQRRFVLERMLLERVIRYDQLLEDRILCRAITVKDRAKAEEILGKLREGADFELLAKQESIAPNREQGGRLPPFGQDYEHPIAAVAFETLQGGLAGPVAEPRGEETLYHVLRVIQKTPGRTAPYAEVEREIAKGLAERPVEEWEYFYWTRKMEKRYGVRYFESP